MARYFVIWCLEEDVELAIDAPLRHGELVGEPILDRHFFTGLVSSSAEISPHGGDDARQG
jgi:hypothetical protein